MTKLRIKYDMGFSGSWYYVDKRYWLLGFIPMWLNVDYHNTLAEAEHHINELKVEIEEEEKKKLIMKASEAKTKADALNKKLHEAELGSILKQISDAAEKGKYEFRLKSMREDTHIALEDMGYTIQTVGRGNDMEGLIKWDK